jgi:hypothetical protein
MLERRFGRAVKLPSTVQLKHQILLEWLADQTRLEADEAAKQLSGRALPERPTGA